MNHYIFGLISRFCSAFHDCDSVEKYYREAWGRVRVCVCVCEMGRGGADSIANLVICLPGGG